ncbi:hypothetical protein BGZ46_009817 [Entomortierella lignicola]|nr:hypothetical protein BGZ46_009817 [Entomortierella lignicola]
MTASSSNRGSSMRSLLAMAGVAGLALVGSMLMPSASASVTIGAAVDTPGSIILGGLSSMVLKPDSVIQKYLVPGLANVTNIGVEVNSSTRVIIHAGASLKNPIGVELPLGQVSMGIWLDGHNLANVTTSNLTLPAGTAPVNVTATIDIASGANSDIQSSIQNLVTSYVGGNTPNGPPPSLQISNLTVSGTSLGVEPINVPTQLTPAAPIPVSNTTTSSTTPPVIGLGSIIDPNATLTWPTLQKVIVKASSGAELSAGVGFSWYNPLNIDIDIPYVSIDVGLDGVRIVTVGINSIHLSPGNMTADTIVDLKFNNDPQASVQVGKFVHDWLAGNLDQTLNVGNLTFGASGSNVSDIYNELNTLFSGITIDIPMINISTIAINAMVESLIQPYLPFPIDISNLGGSAGSSLLNYIKSLAISTAAGHTLLISPQIEIPFPFQLDLNIPYLSLDINLNNNLLGQLFLANLVGSGQGNVSISVGVGIVFSEPSPQIPATIEQLVNGLTIGTPYNITAGVGNLAIGMSPSDAINTLNDLNIALPISSLVKGTINLNNILSGTTSNFNVTVANDIISIKVGSLAQLTVHSASLDVLPGNMVTAGINLDVFLGLPVVANIGYFGVQLALDGAPLAGVGLTSGLDYQGGTVNMNAGVALSIGTGPAIRTNVANLVNAIIAKQTVNSTVGISGIVIGQNSTDIITALSGVAVQLPLGGLIGGATTALPTIPSNFLNSTLAALGLSVSNISLATIPNAGLGIGAKATFSNPIPVSVSVPFIGVSGGLDNIDILNIGIDNLALLPGANALQAQIDLNFNNAVAAQTKVATFVGEILGGQLGNTPEALTVHNLRIGASPTDYFDLLSAIDVSIPSKDILNQANVDLLTSKLGLNVTQLAGSLLSDLQIGAISADLTKAPVIELGASVSVSNVSLSAAVNIGYFGVNLALDNAALAQVSVPSINITTANNKLTLTIKAAVTVEDSPAIETDVANLVNYFMSNTTTSPVNNLVISSPILGVSATDNIQTLSLVNVSIPLPTLLAEARVYVDTLVTQLLGGFGTNDLSISGVVLDLNSPSVINFQGGIEIKNLTLPADIQISYVGASLALDSTPLAQLTVPSLNLTSANNALSVSVQALVNLNETAALNTQIASLVGYFLHPGQVTPPQALVIYDPVFGGDANHLFHILSQVKVSVALAPYLQKASTLISGLVASNSTTNLLAGLDIGSLVIDLNTPQTIGIDAAIDIKNITIPAEINLNYVGVNLAIDTVGLANIAIPSFSLKPVNGALSITAHVDVALLSSPALTTALTNLVTGVINNQTTAATNVVISGAVFGGSSTNVFTILQGIAIPINIAPYINEIPTLLYSGSSLLSRVAIGGLNVNLNSPQTIGITTSVSVKNITLPAKVELNYIGANVALGSVPLAQVSIPGLNLTSSNGNLDISLQLNLALQESTALTQTINGLAQTILAGQKLNSTSIVISGAVFGASPTNVFTFLQGVSIPIDISSIANTLLGSLGTVTSSSLLNSIAISNLDINLNAPQVIGVGASVLVKNISLPAQIELNYVGANVAINSSPLAQVAIPTFTLAPQGNDLALTVQLNLALLSSTGLANTISGLVNAVIGNQTLPQTNLVLSGAVFGASATNFFTILEGVTIPINITPYISQIGTLLSGAGSLLSNIGLSGLAINLNQAPVIGIDADIAVSNFSLPAKLELGYVGLNVGINNVPLVNVGIPKIQLGSTGSALTIATHIDATLQETDASQTLIAGFVNSIVAGQVPQGTIDISGISFGASSTNVFTFLEGLNVAIPISKILSLVPATATAGLNTTSILNNLSLQSADINMNSPPNIGANIAIALLGYQFDAKLLLSYVSISAFLDTTPLATITVPSISLTSGSNQVGLSVQTLVNLASGSDIQAKVAGIVNEVIGNSAVQATNLVVSNIAFGGSASSSFTILKKVQVTLPLTPYIQEVTSVVGGILGGNFTLPTSASSSSLSVTQLEISAPSANALAVAVGATIGGIGSKVSVEMPYIGLQITANGQPFISPVINNFKLNNGQVSLTLSLPFQSGASSFIAGLSTPVSNLLFSTVGTVPGSIVATNIVFGASASQSFNIASQVTVTIQLNSAFQKIQTYLNTHNSLHLSDMNTVLTATGIQATVAVTGIALGSLPLKLDFPISLFAYYKDTPFIQLQATSMSLVQSPWIIDATVTPIEPAFGTALIGILPNVLEWKNALTDVTAGGITLGSFTVLQSLIITPPAVTLWSPINVPLSALKPHLLPLSLDFSATFSNTGPLRVSVGSIDIMVQKGPTTNVLEIQNLGGALQVYNGQQNSGNNVLTLNAALKFSLLEIFTIVPALLNPGNNFQFVFSMKTAAGTPMPWLENALNGVPDVIFANLLPILANAISHVKFGL